MLRANRRSLVLTDEPYNVANVGHVTSKADHREFAMAARRNEPRGIRRVQPRVDVERGPATLVDGGLFATFIDWRSVDLVIACGRDLGARPHQRRGLGQDQRRPGKPVALAAELLPVFKKGDAPPLNNVELGRHGRWRSNVWVYPGASSVGSDAREGLAAPPDRQAAGVAGRRPARRQRPRRDRDRALRRLRLDADRRRGDGPASAGRSRSTASIATSSSAAGRQRPAARPSSRRPARPSPRSKRVAATRSRRTRRHSSGA